MREILGSVQVNFDVLHKLLNEWKVCSIPWPEQPSKEDILRWCHSNSADPEMLPRYSFFCTFAAADRLIPLGPYPTRLNCPGGKEHVQRVPLCPLSHQPNSLGIVWWENFPFKFMSAVMSQLLIVPFSNGLPDGVSNLPPRNILSAILELKVINSTTPLNTFLCPSISDETLIDQEVKSASLMMQPLFQKSQVALGQQTNLVNEDPLLQIQVHHEKQYI